MIAYRLKCSQNIENELFRCALSLSSFSGSFIGLTECFLSTNYVLDSALRSVRALLFGVTPLMKAGNQYKYSVLNTVKNREEDKNV